MDYFYVDRWLAVCLMKLTCAFSFIIIKLVCDSKRATRKSKRLHKLRQLHSDGFRQPLRRIRIRACGSPGSIHARRSSSSAFSSLGTCVRKRARKKGRIESPCPHTRNGFEITCSLLYARPSPLSTPSKLVTNCDGEM